MPSGTTTSQRLGVWSLLVCVVTGMALLLMGSWRMFAHFPGYDDEGYILLTVRSYLEHGGLYAKVYSQYGPGFYALLDLVQRVTGAEIDHAFARWFTLVLWFGGAGCMGACVWRATTSKAAAWFTSVAVFLYLHQLNQEAFHPGVVIVFLLPAVVWAMLEVLRRDRIGWAAAIAGAGTGLLGMLKINVGLLFAVGCVGWALLAMSRRWLGRAQSLVAVAGGALLAAALMHSLLGTVWVQTFMVVFVAGLAGLGAVITPRHPIGGRGVVGFVAGAAGTMAVIVAAVMIRGTSAGAILEGVIIRPLQHADAYSFAVDWRPGTLPLALASLAVLAWHRWLQQHLRAEAADRLIVILRLILLAGLLAILVLLDHFRVIGVLFSYVLPWLWVWVVPLHGGTRSEIEDDARGLLGCVLLWQALHAYPVGGIQICWGSFPVFALMAMSVPETSAWLERRRGRRFRAAFLPALLVGAAGAKTAWMARDYHATYFSHTELALPGTGGLRLSEREVQSYQTMVTNSVLHTDMLFSLPGMFSFNLWSGRPAPTLKNTTLWYSLLTGAEQDAIVQSLERARRPGVVLDWTLVSILHTSGAPPAGPLYNYLRANFQPAFGLHGLGFWVRNGRTIAPVGTAWLAAPNDGTWAFRACLLGPAAAVERMEISVLGGPPAERLIFTAANARVFIQPVNPDGSSQAAPCEVTWPFHFDGLAWVMVRCDLTHPLAPESAWLLELKSADHRRAATAVFVDR